MLPEGRLYSRHVGLFIIFIAVSGFRLILHFFPSLFFMVQYTRSKKRMQEERSQQIDLGAHCTQQYRNTGWYSITVYRTLWQ